MNQIINFIKLIKQLGIQDCDLRVLGADRVKIQVKEINQYRILIKALVEKGTQFHSYQLKQHRAFTVVLKNIHPSADVDEISAELKSLGHNVRYIRPILKRGSKIRLPMFFVDLEPSENNKQIYDIKKLYNLCVVFEPPRQKRDIPQCQQCQRYNHTRKFCSHRARCVKCAGDHFTANCTRTERDNSVVCVLCKGNHPANYKGCAVYQELRKQKFPPLRKKEIPVRETKSIPTQFTRPGISYADMAREKSQQTQGGNNSLHQIENKSSSSDVAELSNTVKNLMGKMDTMLNLLTIHVFKIK